MRRAAVGLAGLLLALAPSAAPAALAEVSAPQTAGAAADGVRDAQYWLDDLGIRTAWQTTRGAGQTIAIIDTGVASGVAELDAAVTGGADFSGSGSSDGRTPLGESSEHGTLVASLAAGRGTGAASGVIGAAPEADLLAISISFGSDSDDQIAEAVVWAVDNGATVINMSLTRNTLDWPTSWDDAFLYAADHDVVIVVAAGNRGSGTERVGAPATIPGVLTVAGVTRAGVASIDASSQGITIGVAAPSESLVGVTPSGGYVSWQGTSGATPIVAGIVALVRAAHLELDAANVIQRVLATARDDGPEGPDVSYGYGIVDASAAVSADVAAVEANPLGDLREWIGLHRHVATASVFPGDRAASPPAEPVVDEAVPVVLSPAWWQLAALPWLATGILAYIAVGFTWGLALHFRRARASD